MNHQIINNTEENRFETWLGEKAAFVEYGQHDDELITFYHTEVPKEFEGQGIGSILAKHVLDYAQTHHLKVRPLCPFIKAYIQRHPEYEPLVYHKEGH
jgi:predicted GNAT family acetyltransferase